MRKTILGCVLLLITSFAYGGAKPERQASLTVTGTISVDVDGKVAAHSVDHPEKLDRGIVAMIDQVAPRWRFEPVVEDGHPVPVKAVMRLSFIADTTQNGGMAVRISAADFRDAQQPAADTVSIAKRTPIRYPSAAEGAYVGGAVYVALRIDRAGNVVDAVTRHVDLFADQSPVEMRRWRDLLGKATLKSVRQWKFYVPTTGKDANDPYVTGTLPVVYTMEDERVPAYGQWMVFMPGPVADVSWLESAKDNSTNDNSIHSEALAAGAFAQDGSGLKLLTPLGG
jgi:hypothetical protein